MLVSGEYDWELALSLHEEGNLSGARAAYERAANLGHAAAQCNLGTLFDDEITPPDPVAAVYWYEMAARAGEACAAWNLAVHYRKKNDREKELEWLEVAANMGDEDAQRDLGRTSHG